MLFFDRFFASFFIFDMYAGNNNFLIPRAVFSRDLLPSSALPASVDAV